MAIKDIFKFKEKEKTISQVEIGRPGTQMFSGFITEEFNADLRDKQGVTMYDRMRKTDAQIFASLNAIKLPLLSAKWFIEPAKGNDVDEDLATEQAMFIEDNLMNGLKWKKQLKLILTFLEFGFKYLEKVFGLDENGKIIWTKWGDRQQTAHLKWEDDNGNRGAQQQLSIMDSSNTNPFMPMEKLLLFSYNREGDNYAGVSLLRTVYKHWWFKETLYKIQGISAERFGVGIPWIQLGNNNSASDKTEAENLGKNMRSNETAYIVTPGSASSKEGDGWNVDILTPKGDPKASAIKDAIEHHNRMITMNILAPFLNLGADSSGSFALSKDQSSFFLLSLKAIAEDIKEVVNQAIEELILYNWADTKVFPKLDVTEIGKTDLLGFAQALNVLTTSGLLDTDDELKRFVRNTMKLPDLPEGEIEEEPEEPEEEPEEEEDNFSDSKKKLMLAEVSSREKSFLKSINENEKIISNGYKLYENELKKTEDSLKIFLTKRIDKAETKTVNGVAVLKSSMRLNNEIKSGVKDIMKKFQLKVSGGSMSKNMMKDVTKLAIKSTVELDDKVEYASSLLIAEPQLKSFMSGHISNMNAVVFNEGRRVLENIHDNITQAVSIRLTKEQIGKIAFNRNIYNLSVTAHPRGLFRSIITDNAKKQGVNHFKLVIPPSKISSLLPAGITAGLLYKIKTRQQWDSETGVKNNVNTVGGLGTHHGSYEYLYPVEEENLTEEQILAKEQRAEFVKSLK